MYVGRKAGLTGRRQYYMGGQVDGEVGSVDGSVVWWTCCDDNVK